MRTEEDRRADDKYDRPRDQIATEQIYKTLRLSGAFKNVFYEKFSEDKVDVIISPRLRRFSSSEVATGHTAAAMGIALIPIVGLF